MIMQIGSPLPEIHIKNTHFTYAVAAPAPQKVGTSEEIGGKRTCIGKMSPSLAKYVDHRVDLNI